MMNGCAIVFYDTHGLLVNFLIRRADAGGVVRTVIGELRQPKVGSKLVRLSKTVGIS